MSNEIKELKQEIDRLQMQALKQFEEKRIPNSKNHDRLIQLKKQLDRSLREGER